MPLMICCLHSENVGFETSFTIVIPQKRHVRCAASPEMRFHSFSRKTPALYLLHDEAAAPTDWLSMTSLERYASERGLTLVLPNCHRSFYCDYEVRDRADGPNATNIKALQTFTELKYESYLMEELIPYVKAMFPVSEDPQDTFLAGIGMGGFGALRLGMKYPETFSRICSVSGLSDLQWAMDWIPEKREQFHAIFRDLQVKPGSAEDFTAQYEKLRNTGRLPEIYFISNVGNPYRESNVRFIETIDSSPMKLEMNEPELTWAYLDQKLTGILDWLMAL